MPPIRRYLRVTRYTVLEVRIHLDDPAQLSWLTRTSNPALPRIIAAIKPLVLPKLREENERAKGKTAAKKRKVKDTVTKDDFEVSLFLTDSSTRHQLLTKTKEFAASKDKGTLKGWAAASDAPVNQDTNNDVVVIREESDDDEITLANIPLAPKNGVHKDARKEDVDVDVEIDVDDNDGDTEARRASDRPPGQDDKKMAPRTTYDGFSIYGRVLCLIIKRQGNNVAATKSAPKRATGEKMMEDWVSTQAAQTETDGATEAG